MSARPAVIDWPQHDALHRAVFMEVVTRSYKFLIQHVAAIALALASAATTGAQNSSQTLSPRDQVAADEAAKVARARELIQQARLALGGEDALGRIQTLSVSAQGRRFIKYLSVQSPRKVVEKEKTLRGKVELDFLLPGQFRKRISGRTPRGFGYTITQIVNRHQAWRDPPLLAVSSTQNRRVIDVRDFERTIEFQAQDARQQLTLYSLAWMLQPLPSYPLEFSYAGQFQTSSGQANVLVATAPENFQWLLLLDLKTSLPLALATAFVAALGPMVIVENEGFDRRRWLETYQRARQESQARTGPPQRYEVRMNLSDYRRIAGVLWPHSVTTTLNGEATEELTFAEFRINRPLNVKKFERPPEQRSKRLGSRNRTR